MIAGTPVDQRRTLNSATAPRYELLQGPRHGRRLGPLTADRHSSVEQIGVDRKIVCHVRMIAQRIALS